VCLDDELGDGQAGAASLVTVGALDLDEAFEN